MIPADVQFRTTANAAAAAFAQSPPYLAYKTDVVVDVPAMNRHKAISRFVETRTRDDYAMLQDLPHGQRQYGHSFPLIPTFDAISYFRVVFTGTRNTLSYVEPGAAITFTDPRATSHADVVVLSLRYYHASYADDSNDRIAHIVMDPLATLTTNNKSDFYLHDVYVDTATNLPTRVHYSGPAADFVLDYSVDRRPLARDACDVQADVLRARCTSAASPRRPTPTNHDFTFPATPSDPKLAQ